LKHMLTPMIQQFKRIKSQYPDCLLFFRLGDFYELFYEDAEIASRELELVLTGRDAGMGERAPMCGVPYHSVDSYLSRLIARGYKVAICEQMEDPRTAKGLVKRDVVRVITPGTVTDSRLLEERKNNYIVAVSHIREASGENAFGLAVADVSTGEFLVSEFHGSGSAAGGRRGGEADEVIADEILRISPSEVLAPPGISSSWWMQELAKSLPGLTVTSLSGREFEPARAREELRGHFGEDTVDLPEIFRMEAGVAAAGALLSYVRETQKSPIPHLQRPRAYFPVRYLMVDPSTRRNLEIIRKMSDGSRKGSLLWVLDRTATAMGARRLRSWVDRPLRQVEQIIERLDAVEYLVTNPSVRIAVRDLLRKVRDVERLVTRVSCSIADARDLVALKDSLTVLPDIRKWIEGTQSTLLSGIRERLEPMDDVVSLISKAIVDDPPSQVTDGGLIRDGYDRAIDELRAASKGGKDWIAKLEAVERERTGIKSLKVGFNKVFGYYIEVTRPNLHLVPSSYIRKQTLTDAERFITPELKEKEDLVLGAQERLASLEYAAFCEVRGSVASRCRELHTRAGALAELDCLVAFAEAAADYGYVRPEVDDGDEIVIRDGRHPVLERMTPPGTFVPNDCVLNMSDSNLLVITGPNMAGKSTYCRQMALIVLMAQIGSFVPASYSKVGVVDRIFTRVGAYDDLAMGQSTFMVEMTEVASILRNATRRSLVILDEIGRGTSTYDGLSIAWAVAEHIRTEVGCRTLLATHYKELTQLESQLDGVVNLTVAVKERRGEVVFLRKIVRGVASGSYGIDVARLAGVPTPVLERAREILACLERQAGGKGAGRRALRETAAASDKTSSDGTVSKRMPRLQLTFFEPPPNPVVEQLLSLDLNNITPLDALNMLYDLQRSARESSKEA